MRKDDMTRAFVGIFCLCVGLTSCSKRGPRDLGNQNPRSEFVDGAGGAGQRGRAADGGAQPVGSPEVPRPKPREIARAHSVALAVDANQLYFGDANDDALFAILKRPHAEGGTQPTRIARRAPMAGALSLDDDELFWIGTPGDVVLRAPIKGGTPGTVRDRGIFTDVVALGGDVFITEARGTGGALTRVTGTTAAHLATLEGTPRGIVVDKERVWIATSSRILSTPRSRGEARELARGAGFASPQVDATWVYATMSGSGRARVLVRVKKAGGPLETVATNVRDAPIALRDGVVYWFDADRPALLATPSARVVSEDPLLARPNAIVVDGESAYVAVGNGEDGRIVSVALR
jgi:hypothetical protein